MVLTLTVGTNTYVTLAEFRAFAESSPRMAAIVLAMPDEYAKASLIEATREIEKVAWPGEKTGGAAQILSFPRTNLYDKYGVLFDSATVPQIVKDAQMNLAFAISQQPGIVNQSSADTNIRRLKAGSAEIEYFGPGRNLGRWPWPVQSLLGMFFSAGGDAASGIPVYSGGGAVSSFGDGVETDPGDRFGLSRAFP